MRASGAYDIWSSQLSKEGDDNTNARAVTVEVATDDNDIDVNVAVTTEAEKATNRTRTRTPQNILRAQIALPAVVLPTAGISYNPPASAHAALLAQAAEEALRAEAAQAREREAKAKLVEARREATAKESDEGRVGVPSGMVVDVPDEGTDEKDVEKGEEEESGIAPPRAAPPRKTKAQRQRAERAKLEVCLICSLFLSGHTHHSFSLFKKII